MRKINGSTFSSRGGTSGGKSWGVWGKVRRVSRGKTYGAKMMADKNIKSAILGDT